MDATAAIGDGIPVGTPVFDSAGQRLGRVVGADLYVLTVGRGLIFTREFSVDLADVDRYEDGQLFLGLVKDQVIGGREYRH